MPLIEDAGAITEASDDESVFFSLSLPPSGTSGSGSGYLPRRGGGGLKITGTASDPLLGKYGPRIMPYNAEKVSRLIQET